MSSHYWDNYDDDYEDEDDDDDYDDDDEDDDEYNPDDRRVWGWGGYRPTISVEGGIRAQSQRGEFGKSRWAKRWIAVLESFNLGARLTRGRSYARQGQVISIDIEAGIVRARVQGSYPQPYRVSIGVKTIDGSDWTRLAASLSTQAIFAAKLLAGEMPQEIEQAFAAAGLSLFPARLGDLKTDCSCPDWSNPCKHIAAVYYLLGEEFDRDPFLIFKLRGMEREAFVKKLGAVGRKGKAAAVDETPEVVELPPQPLDVDPAVFWSGGEIGEDLFGSVESQAGVGLPQRLGKFPFWRGQHPVAEALAPIYERAAAQALDLFAGIADGESEES